MEIRFVDLDQWEAVSERRIRCSEERFIVRDATSGGKVVVAPGLSVHRNLTILGADWIPVRSNGISTLQQMTHSPELYVGKSHNIVHRGDRYYGSCATHRRLSDAALLMGGYANYYHWLFDCLPRLLMARRYGVLDGRRILINENLASFQEETLQIMGVDKDHLLPVPVREALEIEEVCVPNMLTTSTICHPLVPVLLREALPPSVPGAGRRIYLSRQDASTRRLINEPALIELLEGFGFETLTPSQMSVQAQIDACAGASAVVGVHGAAMANLVFCRPATPVVEIYSPAHPASFFAVMARMCQLPFHRVAAMVIDPQPDTSPLHRTWEVDLAAMKTALSAALAP
jgi:capsular polysaccharide biosynthesis protein